MKKATFIMLFALFFSIMTAHAETSNLTDISIFSGNSGNVNGLMFHDSRLIATTDRGKYFAIDPFSDYRKTVRSLPSEWTNGENGQLSGQWGIIPGDDGIYIVSYCISVDGDDLESTEISALLRKLSLSSGGKLQQEAEWELDFETVTDALGDYSINTSLTQACVTGGFLVGKIDSIDGSLLAVFDIEDEDCELVYSDLSVHGPYKDGKVLVSSTDFSSSKVIYSAFDPEEETCEELFSLASTSSDGTAYDAASETLFYISDNMLHRTTISDPESAEQICPVSSGNMPLAVAAGSSAYITADSPFISMYDVSVRISGTVLNIYDGWSWSAYNEAHAAKSEFMQLHPGVIISESGDSDIIQSMMSHSDEIDIYILRSSNYVYDVLKNRGYIVPLNNIDGLEATVNRMYPHLRSLITNDGNICALPVDYTAFSQMSYSDIAMEELGFDHADMPATWVDFFRFITENQHILDENGVITMFPLKYSIDEVRRKIFDNIIEDYIQYIYTQNGIVTFDTPVFRELIDEFEKVDFNATGLTEEGDAPGWTGYYTDTLFWPNGDLILPSAYYNPSEMGTSYQLPLSLTENTDTAVYAEIALMLINPYSKNIELALDFVSAVHANPNLTTLTALCPDQNETKLVPDYDENLAWYAERVEQTKNEMDNAPEEEKAEWEERLEAITESYESFLNKEHKWCWEISDESIAWFRSFADRIAVRSSCGMNSDAYSVVYTQLSQYYDGLITADEMIKTIDQRIGMMMLEAQ